MVRSHPLARADEPHACPHPPNTEPESGVATMETVVPVGRLTLHVLPQLKMPRVPPLSETTPVPAPDFVTANVNMGSTRVE